MATQIIDFSSERERHGRVLGRESVLKELDRLLRGGGASQGWVLIKGGPGMGKSALLTEYLPRLEAVRPGVPLHFLRRGVEDWARPEVVRANLAAQLEALFPKQALPEASPDSRLLQVLQRVSREVLVPRNERLVLVVDGLDEVDEDPGGGNPLERFLPHALPRGVWVLCSSRPMEPQLSWLEARDNFRCIDLDETQWEDSNRAVVREYWESVASDFEPPLDAGFVAEVVQRSAGNILYAVKLADWLQEQPTERRRADQLPRGLRALLEELWQDIQKQTPEFKKEVFKGLALVAAAREALSLSVLASLAGWEDAETEERFLRVARPFLKKSRTEWMEERAWSPFHESFRTFILSTLGKDRAREGVSLLSARLAAWPVAKHSDEFHRRYALRHAVVHGLELDDLTRVRALCMDLGYLEAKCQQVGVAAVEEDLLLASRRFDMPSLRDLHRAVQAEAHWLRREPGALVRILYNRLLCMGWKRERMEEELSFPDGLPSLRLRHPVRMGSGEVRTLTGHKVWVIACALTPDLRLALSASHDCTLKLWDLQAGREEATLRGHGAWVLACALTRDGRRALSASEDKTLKLWDLQEKRELHTFSGHAGGVRACAFTADERLALSASRDRTLKLWDLQTGREVLTLTGHTDDVTACVPMLDGRRALSASKDGTLKLWDLQTGREVHTLRGHTSGVRACALTSDGHLALSASDDRTLKLWDLQTGRELSTFMGHEAEVRACALTSDGHLALSASNDRTLKLWDVRAQRELTTLKGHEAWVGACVLSQDGNRALSASDDRTLKLWDLQVRRELPMLMGHGATVKACALTPDGRLALSASDDRTLKLWDLEEGREVTTLKGHADGVRDCVLTPDGQAALSASDDHTLKLWDLQDRRELATLVGHEEGVRACALASDGSRALSASTDGTLKLWDLQDMSELATLKGHQEPVRACSFTPDGNRALSASEDGTLKLWDLQDRRELATFVGHTEGVRDCVLSPDGLQALSASKDSTLKLWELRTGRELLTFEGHEEGVKACSLMSDGLRALSASNDRTLRLWDLHSGECLQTVVGCSSFTTVAAARDVVCAGDRLGNIWILETGSSTGTSKPAIRTERKVMEAAEPLFSWLHLSDIHIGHGGAEHRADQTLVLDALRRDIIAQQRQGRPAPEAILVTGDIAFSGIKSQYVKAKEWLSQVAEDVQLDLRQVFTVPGNHDVDRAADKDRSLGRLVRALRSNQESLDEALEHEDERRLLSRRMAHYLEFAADFAPACLHQPRPSEPRLSWLWQMNGRRGLRVRLVGLNTALLSTSEPDRGQLRLGKNALAQALLNPRMEEDELLLVLSHHPFLEGWLADEREANNWVRNRAHIHLSGHVHAAETVEARTGSGGPFVRIAAGAVHEEHQPGVPAGHGYNLAAVYASDNGKLELRVWPRVWSDKNKDFRLDTQNVLPNGEYARHELSLVHPSKPSQADS